MNFIGVSFYLSRKANINGSINGNTEKTEAKSFPGDFQTRNFLGVGFRRGAAIYKLSLLIITHSIA